MNYKSIKGKNPQSGGCTRTAKKWMRGQAYKGTWVPINADGHCLDAFCKYYWMPNSYRFSQEVPKLMLQVTGPHERPPNCQRSNNSVTQVK